MRVRAARGGHEGIRAANGRTETARHNHCPACRVPSHDAAITSGSALVLLALRRSTAARGYHVRRSADGQSGGRRRRRHPCRPCQTHYQYYKTTARSAAQHLHRWGAAFYPLDRSVSGAKGEKKKSSRRPPVCRPPRDNEPPSAPAAGRL
ncbi:hypothetical protein BS78_07G204300 [Paspalum vaginatum]|uniref:Uncharacterized protein n=1 Tax=Paspalum vaginatum TaxID=158149 RepID=A0A9W7X9Y3_9POAL|nr:hypothetical protein BS78_K292400 [Paspalum vaginatum]KAJ1269339.1 hypothetical protein BS78_07G204300 [Paspalum vaginatum]